MKIITSENPLLRKRSKKVTDPKDPKIQKLIQGLKELVVKKNGAGLSAIQVGQPARIFVVNIKKHRFTIINPIIRSKSKKITKMEEGCLSFPGFFGVVSRPKEVTVTGLNEDGEKIKIQACGLLAKVIQHEFDHLEGILFVDRLEKPEK